MQRVVQRLVDGSSPRLRGTWLPRCRNIRSQRFIPAPAGNIYPPMASPIALSVHPRACGEHPSAASQTSCFFGSSPRLRGTFHFPVPVSCFLRFIPAPAGNIQACKAISRVPSVHPRACGEHVERRGIKGRYDGSSPRLRGTYKPVGQFPVFRRFIPAPAGNIVKIIPLDITPPVHPRACGEHQPGQGNLPKSTGSSPRLRGTL